MTALGRWEHEGWRGWAAAVPPATIARWLAVAADGSGRRSRHARTVAVDDVFVKSYPAPGGYRAVHAHRMGDALASAGFVVPEVLLVATRDRTGILVTRDVGGDDLLALAAGGTLDRRGKRGVLQLLGAQVARLHAAGFVHGDLVPPNLRLRDGSVVWLDHDRTRRSRLLVAWGGRRNLVQLGRFVVPGITTTDRLRVLRAYTDMRGLRRPARRRLATWVATKIMARRCRIDHLAPEAARRAGFRELMRSGGPFDPSRRAGAAG